MQIITFLILVSSLFTLPSQNSKILTQSFSIEPFTSSLITQLDGTVEIVYWEKDEMYVEMTIRDVTSNTSDYGLDYVINKGNYELDCSWMDNENTILLRTKKNNNTIFRRGQKQKTEQTFKIFIPKRLQISIQ